MFDESFFVALAFFTVIGAFVYFGLPKKLMQSLDAKSTEIAEELDHARTLRSESIAQIVGKMLAMQRGEPVAGKVDPQRGY